MQKSQIYISTPGKFAKISAFYEKHKKGHAYDAHFLILEEEKNMGILCK